jgi:hypothetical protein
VKKEEQRIQSEVHDPNHFLYIDGLPDSEKTEAFSRLRNGEVITQPMTASEHETPVQVPGGLVHHWMAIAFMHGVTADQVPSYQKGNLVTELDQCRGPTDPIPHSLRSGEEDR